jgi:hypothetical protein
MYYKRSLASLIQLSPSHPVSLRSIVIPPSSLGLPIGQFLTILFLYAFLVYPTLSSLVISRHVALYGHITKILGEGKGKVFPVL